MSHIATEEWQSFELRMRRRRAERMVLRAEAALDTGCLDEARAALDEARRLCPTLPSLDEIDVRIAAAAAPVVNAPAARRVTKVLAVAATLAIAVTAGMVGWRFFSTTSSQAVTARPAAAVSNADTVRPSPAAAASGAAGDAVQVPPPIRVETEQVPPVVVAPSEPPTEQAEPLAPAAPPTKSAEFAAPQPSSSSETAPRAVGTAGPATQPIAEPPTPASIDAGINTPLGKETALTPPEPSAEHVTRAAELPAAVKETAPAPLTPRADAAAPESTLSKGADDVALVRGILNKYADAYTRLDADAAKAVWPSVNRAALSRAFNGLNEQRIAFSDCSVLVHSTQARATCSGSATWEPKVGGGARTDVRRWAFDLEKSGEAWVIRDARVQNR